MLLDKLNGIYLVGVLIDSVKSAVKLGSSLLYDVTLGGIVIALDSGAACNNGALFVVIELLPCCCVVVAESVIPCAVILDAIAEVDLLACRHCFVGDSCLYNISGLRSCYRILGCGSGLSCTAQRKVIADTLICIAKLNGMLCGAVIQIELKGTRLLPEGVVLILVLEREIKYISVCSGTVIDYGIHIIIAVIPKEVDLCMVTCHEIGLIICLIHLTVDCGGCLNYKLAGKSPGSCELYGFVCSGGAVVLIIDKAERAHLISCHLIIAAEREINGAVCGKTVNLDACLDNVAGAVILYLSYILCTLGSGSVCLAEIGGNGSVALCIGKSIVSFAVYNDLCGGGIIILRIAVPYGKRNNILVHRLLDLCRRYGRIGHICVDIDITVVPKIVCGSRHIALKLCILVDNRT